MSIKDDELAALIEAAQTGVKERYDALSIPQREIQAFIRETRIEPGDNSIGMDYIHSLYTDWTERPMDYNRFLKVFRTFIPTKSDKKTGGNIYIYANAELLGLPSFYQYLNSRLLKAHKKAKQRKYLGVFKLAREKYHARILLPTGKSLPLGSYSTETEAALNYDIAALQIYGKEAVLNFAKKWKPIIDGKKDIPPDYTPPRWLKKWLEQDENKEQVQALSGQANYSQTQGKVSGS